MVNLNIIFNLKLKILFEKNLRDRVRNDKKVLHRGTEDLGGQYHRGLRTNEDKKLVKLCSG